MAVRLVAIEMVAGIGAAIVAAMVGLVVDVVAADVVKVKIKLAYIDIPVLLQYEATGSSDVRPHVYAGPSFGFKSGCKVEGSGEGVSVSTDCKDAEIDIKSFDLGGVVGAGLTFPLGGLRAAVGARYQHGFSDLEAESVVKNRVLSFYVGLEFGPKK